MAKLYFRYGAMNCGKSTLLLQLVYNYEERGMKVALVKPSIDTKGGLNIVSRTGLQRKIDAPIKPDDKISDVINIDLLDVIVVDEAQFLSKSQIDELYEITKFYDVPILCYGLRCDFNMQGFEGSTRLLQIADSIEELKTICSCGHKATQILRKVNGIPVFHGEKVIIDGTKDVEYESVCGKCYLEIRKERIKENE